MYINRCGFAYASTNRRHAPDQDDATNAQQHAHLWSICDCSSPHPCSAFCLSLGIMCTHILCIKRDRIYSADTHTVQPTSFAKEKASSAVPGNTAPNARVKRLDVALRMVFEDTLVLVRLTLRVSVKRLFVMHICIYIYTFSLSLSIYLSLSLLYLHLSIIHLTFTDPHFPPNICHYSHPFYL